MGGGSIRHHDSKNLSVPPPIIPDFLWTTPNLTHPPSQPVTDVTVAQYAAYLVRRLKPNFTRQYLNIIRSLHLECGLRNPAQDSSYVKTTLRGTEKQKGCESRRKTPMSPAVLLAIKRKLNLSTKVDCTFWAACLVMLLFRLLRRSNLFQDGAGSDGSKQLRRDCLVVCDPLFLTVIVKWTKTIQTRECKLTTNLPALPNHPSCAVQ